MSGAQTVFLHIGRGKAGSTTIQSFVQGNKAFLETEGIHCPLIPNGMANHARLAKSLPDRSSDRAPIREFRRDLERSPFPKLFLSAEALMSMPRNGIRLLQRLTANREVRILAYIRAYPDWVRSLYAQRTKRALSAWDFDAFLAAGEHEVSALPNLEQWSQVFGWNAMRVRTLDRSGLAGGSLVSDVLDALGVQGSPPAVADANVSLHWMTLELLRALAEAKALIGETDRPSIRVISQLTEKCVQHVQPRQGRYLTRKQWSILAERYTRDVETIGRHTGFPLPAPAMEPEERAFLPSFDAIPAEIRADILATLSKSPLAKRISPDTRQLLEDLLRS